MIGIGNYVLGDAERLSQPRNGGGGGGVLTVDPGIWSGISSIIGPGGLPGLFGAFRGGGGGAPVPYAPPSGGGFDIGKVVPFALIGIAVIGGFFVIKMLRKKAA